MQNATQIVECDRDAGVEKAKELMDNWSYYMDIEEAIVNTYNTRAVIFLVLAGTVALAGTVIFIVIKKQARNISPKR